jgi:formate hydrogenlyase subunit 3/multisubunit Na+/H+ antiporter MnhD subunit
VPWVSWGFLFTFLAVIVMLVRWYLKYGEINTSDPDYQKARSWIYLAGILWLAALPVAFIIRPFIALKVIGN